MLRLTGSTKPPETSEASACSGRTFPLTYASPSYGGASVSCSTTNDGPLATRWWQGYSVHPAATPVEPLADALPDRLLATTGTDGGDGGADGGGGGGGADGRRPLVSFSWTIRTPPGPSAPYTRYSEPSKP